jgi:ADP-L-glycero-D-manno-heptose 6-epimerase
MIVVTGGAGFIGSNIIKALNARGITDILIVDDLTNGHKVHNIADLKVYSYMDKDDFLELVKSKENHNITAIFHQGACSSTTEWDGKYVMNNNYTYSNIVYSYAKYHNIPFIYASSASVYGLGEHGFSIDEKCEHPINVYAYSKLLFDNQMRGILPNTTSQVVGLRYFNVYGPREQHKGSMSSVMYHFNNQLLDSDKIKLFGGYDGYLDGEHSRDFVHVDDVVKVNLWFYDNPHISGIYNVGTGTSETYNTVAQKVIDYHGTGKVKYTKFPEHLKNVYQSYTKADLSLLRYAGYTEEFKSITDGVKEYLDNLNCKKNKNTVE